MRKIIIIGILVFTAQVTFSQVNYQIRQALDLYKAHKLSTGDWKNWLEESDIEGSPYMNNDFINGNVFMNSKEQYVDVLLRYNIYNDQIEFKSGENIQSLSPPELIDKIELNGEIYEYIPYSLGKRIKKGFFIRLTEGKAQLYKRAEIQFKKAENAGAYKEAEPAKFIRKPDSFYVKIEEAQGQKVLKRKNLPELFPDKQAELTAFIKKNKVKINEEDLLKLVEYYNSL